MQEHLQSEEKLSEKIKNKWFTLAQQYYPVPNSLQQYNICCLNTLQIVSKNKTVS